MQRARSMLRCSLFSLIEGKVTVISVSFQTFPHFSLQLIATTLPASDKTPEPPQNLSPNKIFPLLFGAFKYYPYLCSILVNKTFFTMGELQSILSGSDGCHKSSESLMSVKLLFNTTTINKSLLSLQRQRRSSWLATKRLGVWN